MKANAAAKIRVLASFLLLLLPLALLPAPVLAQSDRLSEEEREELRQLLLPAIDKPLAEPVPIGWQTVRPEEPLAGAEGVFETVWATKRPPRGPADEIRLHRYRVPRPGEELPEAAVLYLPGTFMNGEAALTDEEHNLWIFLARRGVDVFALDYRTHALTAEDAAGEKNPEGQDLSFLKDWTVEAFHGDVRGAAALVSNASGLSQFFVAGFSLGVSYAYGYAAAAPGNVAGIIALDGFFKEHAPTGKDDLERRLEGFHAQGRYAADLGGSRGWTSRQALMQAVVDDPSAPPLASQLRPGDDPPATVGEQLARTLYFAWGPGRLANPLGGHSDPRVLARLLLGYDRYFPDVQNLEGPAMAAHVDAPWTSVDDGWEALRKPVIFFGTTGMGPQFLLNGIHSAAHCAEGGVEIHVLEGWGHLDVLVGEKAREEVFEPILAFLEKHGPKETRPPGH